MSVVSSQYMPAAVCRRGHTIAQDATSHPPSSHCKRCGAVVLTACPGCGQMIHGYYRIPGVFYSQTYEPPKFCHACGSPYPWAGRQERIYQLQNLLDEEQLDEADALIVREQLEALLNADLDEKEQAKRWKRIMAAAPGFLEKASTHPIVTSLLTAGLKQAVGWPA